MKYTVTITRQLELECESFQEARDRAVEIQSDSIKAKDEETDSWEITFIEDENGEGGIWGDGQ